MALTKLNNQSLGAVTSAGIPIRSGTTLQTKYAIKKSVQSLSPGSDDYLTDLTITLTPNDSNSKFYVSFVVAHTSANSGSSARMFSIYRKIGTGSFTKLTDTQPDLQSSQTGYFIKTSGVPGMSSASSFNPDHGLSTDTGFYLDSPSTTDDVTYRIYLKQQSNGTTLYVNRNGSDANNNSDWEARSSSHMSVMEIAG